ncbi:MAG: exodeoxyribonuclease V subunit alpha [bacterium]|nr:exodeoxyribonuclease V subunit alpha [bacterium]
MVITRDDIFNIKPITELDRQFGRFISVLAGEESPEVTLAALLVSNFTGKGDTCINIREMAGNNLNSLLDDKNGESRGDILLPKAHDWIEKLRKSSVVGESQERHPLVLDKQGRLYLYRYWEYEQLLVEKINTWLGRNPADIDYTLLKEGLDRLFPVTAEKNKEIDWQRIAALAAIVRRFCVISGGPGTGKTATIVKILILLQEQAAAKNEESAIALVAPTGKAAARLKESIKQALHTLDCSEDIKQAIPEEAFTIHRLLGTQPGSPYFYYNAENRLPFNVVVVDESSMADLALMSKLFQAVSPDARLILLGDKDQLASVEAGAVLGDICDTGRSHGYSADFIAKIKEIEGEEFPLQREKQPAIADSLMVFHKSYRFGSNSGIGEVSRAIRDGNADRALELLKDEKYDDIRVSPVRPVKDLARALAKHVVPGYKSYLTAGTPEEAFDSFSSFTILCALRKGPYGVEKINEIVERILSEKGLIDPVNRWYRGRPIIVTRNDYTVKLFNGDVGIIFPDPLSGNNSRFFIPTADRSLRKVLPLKLPAHETVYAMTVHKSQGSEFDNVLVVLPDKENPVLTRELLYTAITRARKRVDIWGSDELLRTIIKTPIKRKSGLRDTLWGGE